MMTNMYVSTILIEWFDIAKMSEKVHFYLLICLIGTQNVSYEKLGWTQRGRRSKN